MFVKLTLALLVVLAVPSLARAGDVSMVVRDVPVGSSRSLQSPASPPRFDMVGVHWQGPGAVLYRARVVGGAWGPWTEADDDSAPDARSPERRAAGRWRVGGLTWTGAADRIEFRTLGVVRRIRAHYVWSAPADASARGLAAAGEPQIVSRFGWQADETIVRSRPQYAPAVRFAVVHHTVNANVYSRSQAAAIVRGIERYHVVGNGWNDIGYNFLIDRYGTVYEGRGGGIERNVIGAHSAGFNTGSVGVALIGTYRSTAPTAAQKAALVRLLAWRLDVAHVDPLSFVSVRSLGNSRYRRGAPVRLRAISGHRDTYFTECPGASLYGQLPAVARAVARTGLPKIYEPLAQTVEPGLVRFSARLSAAAAWTVTVRNAAGAAVATGRGSGTKVDWAWDRSRAPRGAYTWAIEAPGARAATGSIGGQLTPSSALLSAVATAPRVVAPAADGSGSTSHLSFRLGEAADVTVTLLDAAGATLLTLASERLEAGEQGLDWVASMLPDGRYRLAVAVRTGAGRTASATLDVVVDRTLTGLASTSSLISPNGDGILDGSTFSFALASAVPLRLEIQRAGAVLATIFSGQLGPGRQVLDWNGRDAAGTPLPDGGYDAVVTVTDALGDVASFLPLTIDTVAPALALRDRSRLRFSVSEAATVTLVVNGVSSTRVVAAGTFGVPVPAGGVQSVSAQARDAAGNAGAVVTA